jgi:hypothetical protein
MSTQYRLVQSGKTASGGCSADQVSSEPVAPRIIIFLTFTNMVMMVKVEAVSDILRLWRSVAVEAMQRNG